MNLSNRSVLVTGAGSAIGRATVVALGRKRAHLTLAGRREEPLEETARLIEEAGARHRPCPAM